ncbi:hypothetical protein ABKV19_000170 [Rosa sericea]
MCMHPSPLSPSSLFRARLPSSSTRSLTRSSSVQNLTVGGDTTVLRPSTGGKHYSITDPLYAALDMPALSPTMSQGNIAKWRKKGHKELVMNFIVVLVKLSS